MSVFAGKTINHIHKTERGYELYVTSAVVVVTRQNDVAELEEAMAEAKELASSVMNFDLYDFVRYFLMEEKGW